MTGRKRDGEEMPKNEWDEYGEEVEDERRRKKERKKGEKRERERRISCT